MIWIWAPKWIGLRRWERERRRNDTCCCFQTNAKLETRFTFRFNLIQMCVNSYLSPWELTWGVKTLGYTNLVCSYLTIGNHHHHCKQTPSLSQSITGKGKQMMDKEQKSLVREQIARFGGNWKLLLSATAKQDENLAERNNFASKTLTSIIFLTFKLYIKNNKYND